MQISGMILDFYDDSRGEMLRGIYPTPGEIPEIVKRAHVLSPEERQALPDDVYALVLLNGGETSRKYACTDPGNTTLSVLYFLENAGKLPAEAQKVAAANLMTACGWYGMPAPDALEKIAVLGFIANRIRSNPLGALQTVMTAPHVAQGVAQEIQARNAAVRGAPGVVTPDQVHEALGRKTAEVSGTVLAPNSASSVRPTTSKAVVAKVAGHDVPPAIASPEHLHDKSKPPPQMRLLRPHVDVADKTAPHSVEEKKASRYALGDRYPLDGLDQVMAASRYFDTYGRHLRPEDRHEYCRNLVKRAAEIGVPVSDTARKYGSSSLAPRAEIKMAFDQRRLLVQEPGARAVLDQLEGLALAAQPAAGVKTAGGLDCFELIGALDEFDQRTGLDVHYDRDLMDPFFSLLGVEKCAAEEFTFAHGNDSVSGPALCQLGISEEKALTQIFGASFAKEFKKDPISIFRSLPIDQKKIVMRMAATGTSTVEA